jgi:hypothetical protein
MLRQKQRNGTLPLSIPSQGGEFGERGGKRRPGWKFLVFILGTICIVLLNHRGEEFEQPNNPNEPRIAELGIAELQEKLDLLQVSVSAIHKDLSNWAKKGSETATLEERKGIEELKGRLELQVRKELKEMEGRSIYFALAPSARSTTSTPVACHYDSPPPFSLWNSRKPPFSSSRNSSANPRT